jgi:hypothetical protein
VASFVWSFVDSVNGQYNSTGSVRQHGSSGGGLFESVLRNSDPHRSALILVGWIRIQKGKNYEQKQKKSKEISCFEVPDVLFWGPEASPVVGRPLYMRRHLQLQFFFSCKVFSIFGHQNPGSETGSRFALTVSALEPIRIL